MMDIAELKRRYDIRTAWRDLNLPGEPGKCCCSPLREDKSPSFSVFANGERWTDFATGERGDVLDLIRAVRSCDAASAIRFVEERIGAARHEPPPVTKPVPKTGPKLPQLRRGTDAEVGEMSGWRGFTVEALREAERRGFLHFANLWGHAAWCVTDSRRQLFEFRRLDGQRWLAFGRLTERKAHCVGSGKSWPIGTLESESFEKVAVVEGAPDLLAAIHFLLLEKKTGTVAPVGILGASNHRLAPDALTKFAGKQVTLYPHADGAGRAAAREWARAFKAAGAARVMAFDLAGMQLADGATGKDLADLARVSPDCLESDTGRKFAEVMP